jgi:syntaxin-binding protein 1
LSLSDTRSINAVIESITNNREAQPGFDAVYMLMPTSANVDRIIRDFSGGRQQYAGAHLFFIDGPSVRSIFSSLQSPHRLTPRFYFFL